MSGINSLSASLAQIFSQTQSTGSSQSTESSSGVEGIGGFALASAQSTASTQAVDAVSEIAANGQGSVDQLSDQIKAMLLEMQESTDTSATDGGFDAQQLFDDLDTDDDGSLTKDEFLAGKPDDVSDEMAENLWSMMAGSDAESISEDDYLTSMAPPPGATTTTATADESTDSSSDGDSAATSDTESYDPLDTNEDGIVSLAEIMAASPANETASASSTSNDAATAATTTSNGPTPFDNRLMAQLMA
ncbi:hypothetical protein [Thalassospira xiamenensis]|uniref:hypothetical protein n=1 Tax=Thalassospira xiamenensis TaxID=220697 RepID=UPI000DEDFD67|nr:hypothetical protein [Thalassospira xiamenensis]RCK33716.1 hypothetical protein TH24_20905 [Thalassospira xiamenensis]